MDEPSSPHLSPPDKPVNEEISTPALPRYRAPVRADLPRRLMLLFASSLAAFSLTTWFLARVNNAADTPRDASTAEDVVREQLSALAKGESRVAYALFTPRYRAEVPFEAFDALVREHGAMFRTSSIRKETEIASLARSEITLRLESESGDRFVATTRLSSLKAAGGSTKCAGAWIRSPRIESSRKNAKAPMRARIRTDDDSQAGCMRD